MNVARNTSRNGLNISGQVAPMMIPNEIMEYLKRLPCHHFSVNVLKIFITIALLSNLTKLMTGRPFIVSLGSDHLRLSLMPMNFIQFLRTSLIFPYQVSAYCNLFL